MADETVIEADSIESSMPADVFKTAEDVLAYYQMRLRVPKGQRNDYGKYNYRNLEDINDAFKKVQAELWERHGILTCLRYPEDDLFIEPNGALRRHVTVNLHTPFGTIVEEMNVQEPDKQGGMSPSQISGSSSSYARKYAVQGLFAIGAEEDPDELPHVVEDRFPDGTFDAKCRRCGQPATGLDADTATSWPCPTCGAVDWEPV